MKFVAFDLEIDTIEEGTPQNITCAAIKTDDAHKFWYDERPFITRNKARELVDFLHRQHLGQLVTWNGMGFDFRILAEVSGMVAECREIAYNHYDIMFQFMTHKGFPVSLDATARGLGIAGKLEGMDGKQAVSKWAEGEYKLVLDYLLQDVQVTLDVANRVEEQKEIVWITKAGKTRGVRIPKLLTVRECMTLPMADNSWMDTPLTREKFVEWATN